MRKLVLDNSKFGANDLNQLFKSRLPLSLRSLSLVNCGITDPVTVNGLTTYVIGRLQKLDLSDNFLGNQFLKMIAKNTFLTNITELKLRYCGLDNPKYIYEFSQSLVLSKMTSLDLSGNNIGDKGCYYLTKSRFLKEMRKLCLNDCGLRKPGLMMLFGQNRRFSSLQKLDVGNNKFSHRLYSVLPECNFFKTLNELLLDSCPYKDTRMLKKLLHSPKLGKITCLNLSGTDVGSDVFTVLANSPFARSLKSLVMQRSAFGGFKGKRIKGQDSPRSRKYFFEGLKKLDLSHSNLFNKNTCRFLGQVLIAPKLEHLNLEHCELTD